MQKLKVLFFLLGSRNKASSRVRGFWVADALEKKGVQTTIVFGEERSSYFRCLPHLPGKDILYLQKRYSRWDYYLLRLAKVMNIPTVFDMDDAYSRIKSPVTLHNVSRIMKHASSVTMGSRNLLDFAKQYQERSFFLPTCIKLDNYKVQDNKKDKTPVCLGWIGNGGHYGRDLVEILKPPLTTVAAQYKIRFKIVGACGQKMLYESFSNIPGLEIDFIDEIQWGDPAAVCRSMADVDIGLYPVLDNESNFHKCGFKALEYMALEIPVVASPVGANAYIVQHGVDGYHAENHHQWEVAVTQLICDTGKRVCMGQAGRAKVEARYDISIHAKGLLEIMDNVVSKTYGKGRVD